MNNELKIDAYSIKLNEKITFPIYGWAGFGLVILFWTLNWSLPGLRTHWGFFPLWMGFILAIDAIVFVRKGTSLLKRSFVSFIILFVISAPVWWLFELFNLVIKNWHYDGREYFTDLEYFLLASLSFSIVIPAVFEAAELMGTFKWVNKFRNRSLLSKDTKTLNVLQLIGFITLALLLVFPAYFYFLVWLSVYLIIDPVNVRLKNRSLIDYTSRGDWRPIIALAAGCLMCGFFWEMWNYYSYPKWKYYLPMVNFMHVFEMPVLGYIGYIPFSLELFAIYNLFVRVFKLKEEYLQICQLDVHYVNAQLK